jgi:hypothetical protein
MTSGYIRAFARLSFLMFVAGCATAFDARAAELKFYRIILGQVCWL